MMRSSELGPVDLMKIAEEVESFGSLSALVKKAGVSHNMLVSPPRVEGLKQAEPGRQMPHGIFQCSYGL